MIVNLHHDPPISYKHTIYKYKYLKLKKKASFLPDYLCVLNEGPPGGQVCSPGQHWVGWTLQPELTNTADALHDGNVVQKPPLGLDSWALNRQEGQVT